MSFETIFGLGVFIVGWILIEVLRSAARSRRRNKRNLKKGADGELKVKRLFEDRGIPHLQGMLIDFGNGDSSEIDFVVFLSNKDVLIVEVKNWYQNAYGDNYSPVKQNERHVKIFKRLLASMDKEHKSERFFNVFSAVVFVGEYQPESRDGQYSLEEFEWLLDERAQITDDKTERFIENLKVYDHSSDKKLMKRHIENIKRRRS